MGSIIGENIKLSLFGESHGAGVGVVIDGLPAGIKIDEDFMNFQMLKRKSFNSLSTLRQEEDKVEFLSGMFNGYTTGTPLTIFIKNENTNSASYEEMKDIMRPGHADLTASLKYHGFQDYRGGGHFSGRLTAPLVAAGSIALKILEAKGIKIGTRIKMLHNIKDVELDTKYISDIIDKWNLLLFPVTCDNISEKMKEEIIKARENLDSVGGILESFILPNDLVIGEPFFNSLESKLASYLFSIGGVKGVEFGLGFDFAKKLGSEVSDELKYENDKIYAPYNYNGGINGGISNGQPIVVRCVIKPTPSIYLSQNTVNIEEKENVTLNIKGRHDPAIIHRARVVVDSLIALALLDLISIRQGNEWLRCNMD